MLSKGGRDDRNHRHRNRTKQHNTVCLLRSHGTGSKHLKCMQELRRSPATETRPDNMQLGHSHIITITSHTHTLF